GRGVRGAAVAGHPVLRVGRGGRLRALGPLDPRGDCQGNVALPDGRHRPEGRRSGGGERLHVRHARRRVCRPGPQFPSPAARLLGPAAFRAAGLGQRGCGGRPLRLGQRGHLRHRRRGADKRRPAPRRLHGRRPRADGDAGHCGGPVARPARRWGGRAAQRRPPPRNAAQRLGGVAGRQLRHRPGGGQGGLRAHRAGVRHGVSRHPLPVPAGHGAGCCPAPARGPRADRPAGRPRLAVSGRQRDAGRGGGGADRPRCRLSRCTGHPRGQRFLHRGPRGNAPRTAAGRSRPVPGHVACRDLSLQHHAGHTVLHFPRDADDL
ncbi:MAG: putative sodium-dependent bicarbonate transporter, partial [uncultured Sphingosinicella sp.]